MAHILDAQKEQLFAKFQALEIKSETVEHEAAPTCEEHTAQLEPLGVSGFGQAKNLCLRDKKGNMYLITALKDTPTGLKEISERLGIPKSAPLRLANADKMTEALQVQPGSVTPFSMMFPSAASVRLLIDVGFKDNERIMFHPFTNTATTIISPTGFEKFLTSCGVEVEYVDFNETTSLVKKDAGGASPAAAKPQAVPKAKPAKPAKEAKPAKAPPVAETSAAASTSSTELSSDDWATGVYGRPAGELVVKPWSETIFSKPDGWEDAVPVAMAC